MHPGSRGGHSSGHARNAALAPGKGGRCCDHKPLDTTANRAGAGLARAKNRKTIVQAFSHQGGYLRWETCGVSSHIHLATPVNLPRGPGAAPFSGMAEPGSAQREHLGPRGDTEEL